MMEQFRNWSRYRAREIAFGIIIFLVATLSFGLGYLANREWSRSPIIIEKGSQAPLNSD